MTYFLPRFSKTNYIVMNLYSTFSIFFSKTAFTNSLFMYTGFNYDIYS